MKALLYKEFTLSMHPAAVLFLGLSAMLLIPNYPYYVVFFYNCLGIFFVCVTGREMHDIFYTVSQPVKKRDVVTARMLTAVALQLGQMLLAIPFACLRTTLMPFGNDAGMDANTALFGGAFFLLGVFNFVFFTAYYACPDKPGVAFVKSLVAYCTGMIAAEACVFAVPYVRDSLDTPDPQNLPAKLIVLAVGALCYILLTLTAWRKAQSSFEKLDL